MKRRFATGLSLLVLSLLILAAPVSAGVNAITPSTNDANMVKGWAYFTADTSVPGEATLTLVSTRNLWSCFEYRSDGDLSQSVGANPNEDIADGRFPSTCVYNQIATVTVPANAYVEVRMVFGGERDERFDWTYVGVTPIPQPMSLDDCKNGGFADYGFSNQGQCNRYVNTGKDSRP